MQRVIQEDFVKYPMIDLKTVVTCICTLSGSLIAAGDDGSLTQISLKTEAVLLKVPSNK